MAGGPMRFVCDICNRGYASLSCMNRHKKNYVANSRTECLHCNRTFASFAAVRKHERSAHTAAYMQAEDQACKEPEHALMERIAQADVRYGSGTKFIDKIGGSIRR